MGHRWEEGGRSASVAGRPEEEELLWEVCLFEAHLELQTASWTLVLLTWNNYLSGCLFNRGDTFACRKKGMGEWVNERPL